jgi:hypothetical protein
VAGLVLIQPEKRAQSLPGHRSAMTLPKPPFGRFGDW